MAEINTNGLKANSEKRSYSVMEVAEILGVSKKSVYNMCANGTFKCVRIGTRQRQHLKGATSYGINSKTR